MNPVAAYLLHPQIILLALLVLSATAIHLRGRVRLKFARQLTDHSTFVAPYNAMAYLASKAPNRPYLDADQFPELRKLTDNWRIIRDEGLRLMDEGMVRTATAHNDIGFHTFFKRGWKRFYLKWYGDFFPSARDLCPKTVELVQSIPSVNAALFTLMPGKSKLGGHRDPFAGSLRYHLGLMTPNSDDCRIYIDGTPYSWRDGQAILFDETYIHSVDNATEQDRIILFCDVTRPIRNPIVRAINRFTIDHIVKITMAQNTDGEKVGILNKVSSSIYKLKGFFQSIKKWNRKVYYTGKYALMTGIVVLIFFGAYLRHR